MNVRDTITRMSKSEWPPSAPTVLKAVLTVVAGVSVAVMSWLTLSQISSQVVQAQMTVEVQAMRVTVVENKDKVGALVSHDAKIDESIHGINLTTQRLTDMLARHDADIDEIKDDAKDERRRRRSNR